LGFDNIPIIVSALLVFFNDPHDLSFSIISVKITMSHDKLIQPASSRLSIERSFPSGFPPARPEQQREDGGSAPQRDPRFPISPADTKAIGERAAAPAPVAVITTSVLLSSSSWLGYSSKTLTKSIENPSQLFPPLFLSFK